MHSLVHDEQVFAKLVKVVICEKSLINGNNTDIFLFELLHEEIELILVQVESFILDVLEERAKYSYVSSAVTLDPRDYSNCVEVLVLELVQCLLNFLEASSILEVMDSLQKQLSVRFVTVVP